MVNVISNPSFLSRMNPSSHKGFKRFFFYVCYIAVVFFITTLIIYLSNISNNPSNPIMKWIVILVLLTLISSVISFLFMLSKEVIECDVKFWDIWSISHFLLHALLTLAFYIWLGNIWSGFWGSLIFIAIWETWEALMQNIWYNAYCESITNKISDIFFGILGSFFGVGIWYIFIQPSII